MAIDWTVAKILALARRASGIRDTTQMTDDQGEEIINRVYTQIMPSELRPRDLVLYQTFDTAVGDDQYDLDTEITQIKGPVTLDPRIAITNFTAPSTIKISGDATAKYVDGLAITVDGSTSNDGNYTVASSSHSAGTTTVTIDETTIGTEAAAGNVFPTGEEVSEIDLFHDNRKFREIYPDQVAPTNAKPEAMLLWSNDNDTSNDKDRQVFVRPHPDSIYTIKFVAVKKPTDLSGSITPVHENWGWALAYKAAVYFSQEYGGGDIEKVRENNHLFKYHRDLIDSETHRQKSDMRPEPAS